MQDSENVGYLKIIAFINHERFYRLYILQRSHLFGVEFQQAKALFQHHYHNQVKAARNNADRHDAFQATEFLSLFDQAYGGKLDAHHHHPVAGQGVRADDAGYVQDAFLLELVAPGAYGIFGQAEIVGNFFQRFAPVPQVFDKVNDGLINFHEQLRNRIIFSNDNIQGRL